ncbi:precorrin-6y C5,15-methyltransferase (decarboxylating) subunit CbiE [Gordonia sp. X0973]|uniref:precorrin-6y C5,15-methyltransferase (decarboxylating) subunit CbiE n=1 Tax=Gordonia sp. X0973 TaxID=2742602 RepID=UPI000F543149|nr:precorrin-6y C5,15-methyltransferase (decarboxylating) subunit CbiE [Gordonia sp. X0973]QKT07364.1 precorrin-6y C5,15-methyltransferase (decarboxylating) subunit CbiE [Gordonia sp. X0973]
MTEPAFVVVGIGADGWDGLTGAARRELLGATTVYGSARQLGLLSDEVTADRIPWHSPMSAHLRELLADPGSSPIHLLASGDPMFHGLGTTVIAVAGPPRVRVVPHPSSVSLAAARLGWALDSTEVVSLVTGTVDDVLAAARADGRLFVLSRNAASPAQIADALHASGWGDSTMIVLEQLGGDAERMTRVAVSSWDGRDIDPLNLVALEFGCREPSTTSESLAPGLPDDAFDHDGQLTKQPIRALTVAALAPVSGQLLWDVGAGSGSVGIEWLRVNPTGRVIAFERDEKRAARVEANAARHGVAGRLTVVVGDAAAAVAGRDETPDAVFVGGGLDRALSDRLWAALAEGGIFVANAVSIPTQQLLVELSQTHGGVLRRVAVEEVEPLGGVSGWRPARAIVQWAARK